VNDKRSERKKILVVDDEATMVKLLQSRLETVGFAVVPAYSGQEALDKFSKEKIDLALVDVVMPGMGGIEVLKKLKKMNSNLPVVIMTAYDSPKTARDSQKQGAMEYVKKPFDPDELIKIIWRGLEK